MIIWRSEIRNSALWVQPAPRLAGLIEVRNLGLCTTQHLNEARIALVVRLDDTPQRLPLDETENVQGIGLPRLILNAYEASAPIIGRMGAPATKEFRLSKTAPDRVLLVTGMSGAGKSTVLNTLEDMGWEVVDNLPFQLLNRLLDDTGARRRFGAKATCPWA